MWVDVTAFRDAVEKAKRSDEKEPHLRQAVDLYRGDFCQGAYNWTEQVRHQLRLAFIDAAVELANILEVRGDFDGALEATDRAIASDQHAEHLCRRAMTLESKRGRRDAVVKRFRSLEKLLWDDLDVAPEAETVEAFRALTAS